jgi:hypothetical protein
MYLKSRCAGLLEVAELGNRDRKCDGYLKVGYLHRSVRDFLQTQEIQAVLQADTRPISNFEPNVWVLMSYITRLRRFVSPEFICTSNINSSIVRKVYTGTGCRADLNDDHVYQTESRAMQYAASADRAGDKTHIAMVDVLDQTVCCLWPTFYAAWHRLGNLESLNYHFGNDKLSYWRRDLFTKAVMLDMTSYVDTKLRLDETILTTKAGLSSLEVALVERHQTDRCVSVEMIEILLKHGADANRASGKFTIWQRTLEWVHTQDWDKIDAISSLPSNQLKIWANIFKLLLHYGANPYATCRYEHKSNADYKLKSHKVLDVIADIFHKRLPHEADELSYIVQKQMEIYDKSRTTWGISPNCEYQHSRKRRRSAWEEQGHDKQWTPYQNRSGQRYDQVSRQYRHPYLNPRRSRHDSLPLQRWP